MDLLSVALAGRKQILAYIVNVGVFEADGFYGFNLEMFHLFNSREWIGWLSVWVPWRFQRFHSLVSTQHHTFLKSVSRDPLYCNNAAVIVGSDHWRFPATAVHGDVGQPDVLANDGGPRLLRAEGSSGVGTGKVVIAAERPHGHGVGKQEIPDAALRRLAGTDGSDLAFSAPVENKDENGQHQTDDTSDHTAYHSWRERIRARGFILRNGRMSSLGRTRRSGFQKSRGPVDRGFETQCPARHVTRMVDAWGVDDDRSGRCRRCRCCCCGCRRRRGCCGCRRRRGGGGGGGCPDSCNTSECDLQVVRL